MVGNDNLNLSRDSVAKAAKSGDRQEGAIWRRSGVDSVAEVEKSGDKSKLIIVIVILSLLLLLAVGAVAYLLLVGGGQSAAVLSEQAQEAQAAPGEPIYVDVSKVLVNLQHGGRTRYVQADIELMSYSPKVIEQAQRDMPAIRDRLLFLLNAQDFAALKTVQGKEALRADALQAVNAVLGLEPPDAIEALYFENFILQ